MKIAIISLFVLAEIKFLVDYYVRKIRQEEESL